MKDGAAVTVTVTTVIVAMRRADRCGFERAKEIKLSLRNQNRNSYMNKNLRTLACGMPAGDVLRKKTKDERNKKDVAYACMWNACG